MRERLVAHLAVITKRAPQKVAPRLRRTGLGLVLAHHLCDMHGTIATCHMVIITLLSFRVKYYLGYITSSPRAFPCSSTGQITPGCGGKFMYLESVLPEQGHDHDGETWFVIMDSNQGPQRRLFLSSSELNTILQENGVAFRPESGTTPSLLRDSGDR